MVEPRTIHTPSVKRLAERATGQRPVPLQSGKYARADQVTADAVTTEEQMDVCPPPLTVISRGCPATRHGVSVQRHL